MRPLALLSPLLFTTLFYLRQYQDSFKVIPIFELVSSSILFIFITLVLFVAVLLFIGSKEKASIITSLFLIVLFFYPDFFVLFTKTNIMLTRMHSVLIAIIAVIFLVITGVIIGSRRSFYRTNVYFSIVGCSLILIQLGEINLFNRVLETNYKKYLTTTEETVPNSSHKSTLRDIYFIVLDSYTSSNSLKELWGYDNTPFINYLREKGFFIAENSVTPYTWTGLSIASVLNMSYINNNIKKVPDGVRSYAEYQMIQNNLVMASLRHMGYKLLNYSLFDFSNTERFYTYPEIMSGDSSFAVSLYNKTLLGFIKQRWIIPDFSKINLDIIDLLKKEAKNKQKGEQPKFVYAHLMTPHWPYHFDRNGNITTGEKLRGQWNNKDKYLDQLIYTNYLITDVINTILSNYETLPIIIIQGDHGFRLLDGNDKDREAHTIFNAYYLPGINKKKLCNATTPANSFRLIFNKYFGTSYVLLAEADITKLVGVPDQQ